MGDVSQKFPRGAAEMVLQAPAVEARPAQAERRLRSGPADDATKAALDDRAQRHALSGGELAGLSQQWIGDSIAVFMAGPYA
jgi:hypothetical protein